MDCGKRCSLDMHGRMVVRADTHTHTHSSNGSTARRNCQMELPDPRPRVSKLVLGTPSLAEMSMFHPANPPEPKKQHGPISSWVLVMQITHGQATNPLLHTYIANKKHIMSICLLLALLLPVCLPVCLSACPNLALAPSQAPGPRGWATGGAAISTWYRKHPHPHRQPGPGPGLHVGSPGSACAHFLGSLAASPRSHAKIPGPGPSFSGICTVPQPSHRHAAWKVRSTCLQSTGPVSPGATWEHGRLQQQACVVVGGTGLPCGHLGIETTCPLWYLMDRSIVTVLCCVVFYCTVLQSRTQVRREPYVGRRTIPSSCPSGRDCRHLKFRSTS